MEFNGENMLFMFHGSPLNINDYIFYSKRKEYNVIYDLYTDNIDVNILKLK